MIRLLTQDDDLSSLIASWWKEGHVSDFGFSFDPQKMEAGIRSLPGCLVMEWEGRIVGFMGLAVFTSPFGPEQVANEHYWYVLPEHRGLAWAFIKHARKWAQEHGCSHVMLNASYMASDKCDRVSSLYEKMGFEPFERTYLGRA